MNSKKRIYIVIGVVTILLLVLFGHKDSRTNTPALDSTPTNVTLSGTYVCLPLIDNKKSVTDECVFGIKTDDGVYYMVNFGQTALAKDQFDTRSHITAEGFVVIKEALNTDQWAKYTMKGIFTITKMITVSSVTH
jgi:hypothetical protein